MQKRNLTYLLVAVLFLGFLLLSGCRAMDCGCPMH